MALINIHDVASYLVRSVVSCSSSKSTWRSTNSEWISCENLRCVTKITKILFRPIYTFNSFYQQNLAPATYWHDVNNESIYRKYSSFLSLINNELSSNENYVHNLQRLRRLVLVKFINDISVVPNESAWFGSQHPNGTMYPLEMTDMYREDKLGLRQMINEGRLIRLLSPLAHLELDKEWFRRNIIPILTEY